MIAASIDEPTCSDCVELLDVLSPEESRFYSCEDNVVDLEGKSLVIAQELEERYGFIGGSSEEYIRYFHRDLPPRMWHWATSSEVKAIAGFSVVPKKDPTKQRKLLMQCAANYWWSDCRSRENHGMLGAQPWHECTWTLTALRQGLLTSPTLSPQCLRHLGCGAGVQLRRWLPGKFKACCPKVSSLRSPQTRTSILSICVWLWAAVTRSTF